MVRLGRKPAQEGIVSVEMALLLPLLLILTFGMIEYGWMFLKSHQITNAARHGARIGVTPDAATGYVISEVNRLMSDAGMASSGYTLTLEPSSVEGLNPGETVTVRVTVPYANVMLMGLPLIPVPGTISAETTMAKEGP